MNEIIGLIAGCLTTLSFLPQVWHVWRTRSTQDISLVMYWVFCTGVFLWIVYGTLIGSWAVILANIVTFVLAGAVLAMKIYYER